MNPAARECWKSGFYKTVIDANRSNLDSEFLDAESFHQLLLNRLFCFSAQTAHPFFRVVSRERGQIHAGNRSEKPCCLPLFLYRSPGHLRLRPPFYSAGVYADVTHPVQIEGNAGIWQKWVPVQGGDCTR